MRHLLKITAFCFLFLSVFTLRGQDNDPMKAFQDYITPGPMHQWLASHSGTWESEVSMWMDPAAPATKSASTDVVTMSMNGLFQIGNFTSTMMGMPFQGQSTLGYDNAKKLFMLCWIDVMSSGMILMTGTYDEKTKTLTLTGTQTDPLSGKDVPIRQVNVYHDADSYTMYMYGAGPDGKEFKFMEGLYKRKK